MLVGLVFLANNARGQGDTAITFDRPGIADSPYLVPRGSMQVETGLAYQDRFGLQETYLPVALLRIPAGDRTELRFSLNYEPQSLKYILHNFANDLDPVAVGFKRKLLREKGLRPEVAVSGNVFYPLQGFSKNFEPKDINADAYLLFNNCIGERHGLNYNAGYVYASNTLKNVLAWSFCYNFLLTRKTTVFTEYFGYHHFLGSSVESGADAGVVCQVTRAVQVDVSYIFNYYDGSSYGFVAAGISANISGFTQRR